jgi:hypothetical protein
MPVHSVRADREFDRATGAWITCRRDPHPHPGFPPSFALGQVPGCVSSDPRTPAPPLVMSRSPQRPPRERSSVNRPQRASLMLGAFTNGGGEKKLARVSPRLRGLRSPVPRAAITARVPPPDPPQQHPRIFWGSDVPGTPSAPSFCRPLSVARFRSLHLRLPGEDDLQAALLCLHLAPG